MDTLIGIGGSNLTVVFAAGIAIGLLVIIWILRTIFGKRGGSPHFQSATCPDCGWHGHVSRFAGRCPQCNRPLGEQKARHRT